MADSKIYFLSNPPPTRGLNNTGVICYLNTLLQCLMSVTQIRDYLIDKGHVPIEQFGTPINEYLKLEDGSPFQSAAVYQSLLKYMKAKGISFNNFIGQASSSEAYVYLMDALNVEYVTMHRYMRVVTCGSCGKNGTEKKEESTHFEIFEESALNIKTPEEFANNLLRKTTHVGDYKCEHCNNTHCNTQQVQTLTMVPDALVILFNKYTNMSKNQTMYCPNYFEFPGVDGPMKYEQVGQARHYGSLGGGHYFAVVKRQDRWYIANDMQITPTIFEQSPNTYMVFYSRIK